MKKYSRKYPKKAKRTYRKKYTKKTNVTRSMTNVRLGKGFPSRMAMTHRYSGSYTDQVVSTQFNVNIRCNGMFDPEAALGGGQPIFFDQMSALYNHYQVIGSRIKWTINRQSGATNAPLILSTFINDDTTTAAIGVYAISDQYKAKLRTMPATTDRPLVLFQNWSLRKRLGNSTLNNFLVRGSPSADPAEQSIFTLVLQTAGSPPPNTTVTITFEVEYIAVWTELKETLPS